MAKRKTRKLPFERKLPSRADLAVYPPEGKGRPVFIQGRGFWNLLFEPTDDPSIASVRLLDTKMTLSPFNVIFDVDGDGLLE